jgi:hypothetical protein
MDIDKSIEKAKKFLGLKTLSEREDVFDKQINLSSLLETLRKSEGWIEGFLPLFYGLQKQLMQINLYGKEPLEREEARTGLMVLDRLMKNVETKISEGVKALNTLQKLKKEK